MRGRGDGPPFVRLGPRCVGYLEADVDAWLRSRRSLPARSAGLAFTEAGG
jgi:predicted DNA-binding transcriptional regulator AlpA